MIRVDRSGPLREGGSQPAIAIPPHVPLPALALIIAYMAKRPAWADREPFKVPAELYADGEAEMREHMRKRGFAMPIDKNLEQDGIANFMLLGTAVVSANG